jgi:dTDP-4-dehydrorhamnose reductase
MTLYIFGANGMLGRTIFKYLSGQYKVVAFYRNSFDPLVHSFQDLVSLFDKHNIQKEDCIINCLGIIPQKGESKKENYYMVNTVFPLMLEEISQKLECHFIQISTNCVFESDSNCHDENSLNYSHEIYSASKRLGEPANSTVIRTSIIGEEESTSFSLLNWLLSKKNSTVTGFTNHYWNGVTCLQLSKIIKHIIDKNVYWKGVRHIFSPEIVSKSQLLKIIADVYKINIAILDTETPKMNQKTLSSIYNTDIYIPSIREQILEQKQFFDTKISI